MRGLGETSSWQIGARFQRAARMSFFTPEGEETCSEAASRVFDALLEQIAGLEGELGGLREHLREQPPAASEVEVVAQGVEGWQGEQDPEIRF